VAVRHALIATLMLSAPAWADSGKDSGANDANSDAQTSTSSGQAENAKNPVAEGNKPSLMGEVKVIGYQTRSATSATGVVTDIINTPLSISAITGDFLKDTGSSQIMDAISSLSGVTGQNNSGEVGTNFSVRGYAVTPQIDGFDSLTTASGLGSSAGIERIEVLKGPSAVFNGNVPPGGSINVIYKKPSFTPKTYFEVQAGSWAHRSGEFFSTGPLMTDQLAYLVDLYAKDANGWVDWTGQKERTAILGLTYRPTDALSINVNYRDIDTKARLSTLPVSHAGYIGSGAPQNTILDDWVAQNYGPNEPPQTITVPQYLPRGERYNVLGPQNYNKERSKFWSSEISYTVNDHIEIRDNFAHLDYNWGLLALLQSGAKVLGPDGKVSTNGFVSGFLGGTQGGSGWENKLEAAMYFDTGPISHSLLVGFQASYSVTDYFRIWVDPLAPVNGAGQPWDFFRDGPLLLQDEFDTWRKIFPVPNYANATNIGHTNTHAYYVAEQMSMLNDRLHALIGLRYTRTVNQLPAGDSYPSSDTTPQIGLLFKPFAEDSFFGQTSLFANYSRAFTPSWIVQPGTNELVPPRKGEGTEFGVKTSWLDGRLTSTISFFRDDLSNIATPDYSHQGQGGSLVLYNLGGVGRAQGMEAEVTWTPTTNLQLSANFTNLPVAKYTEYPGVPQEMGLRFPATPRQQANFTGKYTIDEGTLAGLYFGGWIHLQSSTRGVLAGDWHYDVRIPGLAQITAFAGYRWKNVDFRFNIDNLTDRGGYVMNNAFRPQSPRAYYLTAKYTL